MRAKLAKLISLVVVCLGLLLPASVAAKVPIYSLSPTSSSSQAGAHADVILRTEIGARGITEPSTVPCVCNTLRDLKVNTPSGLIATPGTIPQCSLAELTIHRCPVDSQLGLSVVRFLPIDQGGLYYFQPLYNMVAREDELALLAFPAPAAETPVFIDVTARTESDYGLEFKTFGIANILPPNEITTFFWGIPADPVHDPVRFPFEGAPQQNVLKHQILCGNGGNNPLPSLIANEWPSICSTPPLPTPANSPVIPFTQNPTACLGPLQFSAETFAYDLESDYLEAPFPAITGCDQLSFDPSLAAKPTTTEADSPSGLDVDLTVPQSLSPAAPTPSAIRAVTLSLPPGVSLNSNAADGKLACTDEQARFGTREPAQCPEFSKIGTIAITSSSFPGPLNGALYLGEPRPGNRYRVFQVFDGFGLHVKLPGVATPDPETGRLSVTFEDLPQFNFQEFDLHVFGAERGVLVTPDRCGTYPVDSTFTPWSYPSLPKQTSTQFFVIDSGPGGAPCPGDARPFNPAFDGGISDNTAGRHSSFSVSLTRADGDQNLTALNVETPPGFSATLKGIPYCPETAIAQLRSALYSGLQEMASASCPADSRLGTVVAGAGAGSKPLYVDGRVYWAGPYKRAPLSLLIVIPAVSGPYDLGNVLTRVALHVDPVTARVSAISDPLPQILDGTPLRTRSIRVLLDRPGFVLNPTNCDPAALEAQATGDEGAVSNLSVHFQVANCSVLDYRPGLKLRLTGGVRRLGHPAIHAVLTGRPGDANNRRVAVTLPKGELLDNSHIGTVCTRVAFAADACPKGSQIGRARVVSPLIDQPLSGAVYLRSSSHELPDMALDLEGQFDIEAAGRIDSVKGRLRTVFPAVPDVPVSRIELDLFGGARGLLQNTESLCGTGKRATVSMRGQNGSVSEFQAPLRPACGKKSGDRKHRGAKVR